MEKTDGTEDTIRIISARKATKYECKNYEKEIAHSLKEIKGHER